MLRRLRYTILALIGAALIPNSAAAQVSAYTFSVGSGTATSSSGATALWTGGNPGSGTNNRVQAVSLPFTFTFNGVAYTQISISSNGLVGFGTTSVTSSSGNNLTGANVPIAAGFWDELTVAGGCFTTKPQVSYVVATTGTGRAFVILYNEMDMYPWRSCFLNSGTFEIRLYEGSNKIEFYYGKMNPCSACDGDCYGTTQCMSTSASIGLASSSSDYLSVTPSGSSGQASSSTANNNVNINGSNSISEGTLYTFIPCTSFGTGMTGPGNGGTSNLNNGDVFFSGTWLQTGQQLTFTPMNMKMTSGVCPGQVSYIISGPAAADYYFGTPGTQSRVASLNGGVIDTAKITFRPLGSGVRNATLTVIGTGGYARTFTLAAAAPRINFYGIIPQGGTANMRSGDTLMRGVSVNRLGCSTFTPMQLVNIDVPNPPSAVVNVTYTLVDPTGQYQITPASSGLDNGQSAMPTITFCPVGVGFQPALLIVNTEDEERTFVLYAYSAAPGGEFFIGANPIDSTSALFNTRVACVGEGAFFYPVTLRNIGDGDFVVNKIYGFLVDSVYRQGTPSYPLLRDEHGELMQTGEYFFSTQAPGSGAVTPLPLPHVIPQGGSETIYLVFIPHRPGKRFVRVYVESNGQNFTYPDTAGVFRLGLLAFNTYGLGYGSSLSDNPGGGLPNSLIFGRTPIGTTATKWLVLQNAGTCDLRISENDLRIFAGDVEEIKLVNLSTTWTRDALTGDLVLAGGKKDSMQVSFTPTHIGSRRASLRLKTNDSTINFEQLSERGSYYMDIYGEGTDGLYTEDVNFGQIVIGSSSRSEVVSFRNAADVPFIINSATIVGTDAGDYAEDGSNAWPARPFAIMPGQRLDLSVIFTPGGTVAGPRSAQLELVTDRDDTVRAVLVGEAGTQSATGPAAVNFGNLTVGKVSRQTIAITNAGTMPVNVGDPVISGANAGEYGVSPMVRHELLPGQVEMVEVSWRPAGQGASSATLTIGADGGDVVIGLSGTGVKTKFVGEDPTGTIGSNDGGGLIDPGTQDPTKASGVEGVTRVKGLALWQSVPNPAHDRAEIRYAMERGGEVELGLYDASGRLVRMVEAGMRADGEHRVTVELSGLAAGVYRYRLTVGGVTIDRSLVVTH